MEILDWKVLLLESTLILTVLLICLYFDTEINDYLYNRSLHDSWGANLCHFYKANIFSCVDITTVNFDFQLEKHFTDNMTLTLNIIYWDTQYNTQMYEWQWWLIGDMFMFSYCLTEVHIAIAYCKALSYGLITFGLKHRWTSRFNNSAVIRSVVYITCLWEQRGGNVIKGTMCCMAFARWFHCHVWFDWSQYKWWSDLCPAAE